MLKHTVLLIFFSSGKRFKETMIDPSSSAAAATPPLPVAPSSAVSDDAEDPRRLLPASQRVEPPSSQCLVMTESDPSSITTSRRNMISTESIHHGHNISSIPSQVDVISPRRTDTDGTPTRINNGEEDSVATGISSVKFCPLAQLSRPLYPSAAVLLNLVEDDEEQQQQQQQQQLRDLQECDGCLARNMRRKDEEKSAPEGYVVDDSSGAGAGALHESSTEEGPKSTDESGFLSVYRLEHEIFTKSQQHSSHGNSTASTTKISTEKRKMLRGSSKTASREARVTTESSTAGNGTISEAEVMRRVHRDSFLSQPGAFHAGGTTNASSRNRQPSDPLSVHNESGASHADNTGSASHNHLDNEAQPSQVAYIDRQALDSGTNEVGSTHPTTAGEGSDQIGLSGLVEAEAVTEMENLQVAKSVGNDDEKSKHVTRKIPWWKCSGWRLTVFGVGLVLVAVVIGVGAVFGAQRKVHNETTQLTSSGSRERMIQKSVEKVMGRPLTKPSEIMALYWMSHKDPRQLMVSEKGDSASKEHEFVQRFALVDFYFSTTSLNEQPWVACNPSSEKTADETCRHAASYQYNLLYEADDSEVYSFVQESYHEVVATRWLSAQHECQWAGIFCGDNKRIKHLHLRKYRQLLFVFWLYHRPILISFNRCYLFFNLSKLG